MYFCLILCEVGHFTFQFHFEILNREIQSIFTLYMFVILRVYKMTSLMIFKEFEPTLQLLEIVYSILYFRFI